MYSVIEAGGFQHKVTLGESLKLPKMEAEIGSEVSIDKVLLASDGDKLTVPL
jgi:large subunit ribosomal protein L21